MNSDPTLLALLHEMNARLIRIEAAQRSQTPDCALTAALAEVFPGNFTSAEAWDKAAQIAARDRSQGRASTGLPKLMAEERITGPHAFGRWAAETPGIIQIGKQNGLVLWRVSEWVDPPKVLLPKSPPRKNHEARPRRANNTGD